VANARLIRLFGQAPRSALLDHNFGHLFLELAYFLRPGGYVRYIAWRIHGILPEIQKAVSWGTCETPFHV
jgi:hypothetical protein